MRPFCCTKCDLGWSDNAETSNCWGCGRPGFTTHLEARQHAEMGPIAWNMLFGAAYRKEKEDANSDSAS